MNTAIENADFNLFDLYYVLKKRYKLMIGTIIAAILVTSVIIYFERPSYQSSFMIKVPYFVIHEKMERMPVISNFEIKKIFDDLNSDLKSTTGVISLTEKIGIAQDEIKDIANVTATPQRNLEEFIEVTINVRGSQPVYDFKKALLKILNERVSRRVNDLRKKNLFEKREIDLKMDKMVKIRDFIFAHIKSDGLKYLGFNPLALERDLLNFKMRSLEIDSELKSLSEFEVISEAMTPKKVRPKIFLNFTIALIISLLAGTFLSFFLDWVEKNKRAFRVTL